MPVDTKPTESKQFALVRRFLRSAYFRPFWYLRVTRLQRAIAATPRVTGLAELAATAGYADQAHLARDCRALTGLTPSAYFS